MELFSSNVNKFFIFSQKKAFLIFQEMELFHILGNGNPKNSLYFRKRNFFIFQKIETPKIFFKFQKELPKLQMPNFLYSSKKRYE